MDDEVRRLNLLTQFITTVEVIDAEWDTNEYVDVQLGIENGMLIVTSPDDLIQAVWAPGSWMHVNISREPRLESTGDEDDNDGENDATATERDTHLPRDGA